MDQDGNRRKRHIGRRILVFCVLAAIFSITSGIITAPKADGVRLGDYFISLLALDKIPAHNGEMFLTPTYEKVCTVTIHNETKSDMLVCLEYLGPAEEGDEQRYSAMDSFAQQDNCMFYVERQNSAKVSVPVGEYHVHYATGHNFYGQKYLFGYLTSIYHLDNTAKLYCTYGEPYHSICEMYKTAATDEERSAAKLQMISVVTGISEELVVRSLSSPGSSQTLDNMAAMSFEKLCSYVPNKTYHNTSITLTNGVGTKEKAMPSG